MEAHLPALLFITISSTLCVAAGVLVLLWRGHQAATLRSGRQLSTATEMDGLITWNETTTLGATGQKTLEAVKRAFTAKLLSITGGKVRLPTSDISIIDPVDGTAFQEGETIVRCRCGTNYHQHSWQWIGEKNGARCVNCKCVDLVSTYTLSGAGTASSDRSCASRQR